RRPLRTGWHSSSSWLHSSAVAEWWSSFWYALFRTSDVMAITKRSIPVEAISASLGMSQAFATSPPPLRSARALLHPAEDIGSALKAGVDVCQRQLVNEVFGPLVTKFVSNLGREDATPIQRGSKASLLCRVHAVTLIRHKALRHLRAAPCPLVVC